MAPLQKAWICPLSCQHYEQEVFWLWGTVQGKKIFSDDSYVITIVWCDCFVSVWLSVISIFIKRPGPMIDLMVCFISQLTIAIFVCDIAAFKKLGLDCSYNFEWFAENNLPG